MNTENLTWENTPLINTVSLDYRIEIVFKIQNLEVPFKKQLQVASTIYQSLDLMSQPVLCKIFSLA